MARVDTQTWNEATKLSIVAAEILCFSQKNTNPSKSSALKSNVSSTE